MFYYHKDIKKGLMAAYNNPTGEAARRVEVLSCIVNGITARPKSFYHLIICKSTLYAQQRTVLVRNFIPIPNINGVFDARKLPLSILALNRLK